MQKMSTLQNVHLAAEDEDDLYSGFNDYNPIMDAQELLNDEKFQQAVAKTSHGRRPTTGKPGTAVLGGRLTTAAAGGRGRTALASARPVTASGAQGGIARPMTAVRGAGYSSYANRNRSLVDPLSTTTANDTKVEDSPEEKCRRMEKQVNELLTESIFAYDKGDLKQALEKAKEAVRKERAAAKLREQLELADQMNLDLTFNVLFNLAHQYAAHEMCNEALNTYQVIVKNKMFNNAGRLKVNIGNIYFRKKDYGKAIKYYRMALDQVPNVQKETRIKILNNIGVAFVKLGKYDDAISTFEHCMEEKAEFRTGLNLLLCAYTVEDRERMKDTFQKLLEISLDIDDDDKYSPHNNDPEENAIIEIIKNDTLRQWERNRHQEAERTILTAAKLMSPLIASNFSDGYAWCVDMIKQSSHAELASELEINKAIQYLKQRELNAATEILKSFEKKETKVASAAATNLSFVHFLQKDLAKAEQSAEQAISADRYNPAALVNRGNVYFVQEDFPKAREFYREALSNEATCVEAMYNLALVNKKLGKLEEALECFYKLHSILRNNVQVMYQIGNIYEGLEDTGQALEWYSMAHNLAPTDPGLLAKLGELYDSEGDKTQAFQCHYDSYRYYPSNMSVIEWLGAYYIDAQFPEKAAHYFEKAELIQPSEVKWQLMIASCHRRSGNYKKAMETYKNIHCKFPENIECLKFLVRLTTDMGLREASDYAAKLKKAEKIKEIKEQKALEGGSANTRHGSLLRGGGSGGSGNSAGAGRAPGSRGSLRSSSGGRKINFDGNEPYSVTHQKELDVSYIDPLGPAPERPKTGFRRNQADEGFDNEDIGDDLLPD